VQPAPTAQGAGGKLAFKDHPYSFRELMDAPRAAKAAAAAAEAAAVAAETVAVEPAPEPSKKKKKAR
jgi:hypothetical protein